MGLLGELGATWSPLGRAADPDRHALRPVRVAGPGALVLRHLRRRSVDPGRHPVRRHPGPRGRGAPVDHHALDRAGAAGLRRLGAGVRPGPGVVLPARDGLGRRRGRDLGVLPALHPPPRPRARPRPRGRHPARAAPAAGGRPVATGSPTTTRRPSRSPWSASARSCPRCSLRPTCSTEQGVTAGVVCLTSPDLVFRSFQQRGSRTPRRRRRPRPALPGRRTRPRWSPSSTATRTPWPSSPAPAATASAASASASSASPPTSPTPSASTASTPAPSSAPPSTSSAA